MDQKESQHIVIMSMSGFTSHTQVTRRLINFRIKRFFITIEITLGQYSMNPIRTMEILGKQLGLLGRLLVQFILVGFLGMLLGMLALVLFCSRKLLGVIRKDF